MTFSGERSQPTFLKQEPYATLFVTQARETWRHRTTFTYCAAKQIWSISPNFPVQSYISPELATSYVNISLIYYIFYSF